MTEPSILETEAAEAPDLVAQQFDRLAPELAAPVERLVRLDPVLVATLARGTSDHAAGFAAYLFGLELGLPVASVPPSIASVYGRALRLDKALVLAISQSGASPDLCVAAERATQAGAFTLGLINRADSSLGRAVTVQFEIGAGTEFAVAASKSFILTLTALAHLTGAWSRNAALLRALRDLPAVLAQSGAVDWSPAMRLMEGRENVFVVGRGPALPVARELALKLKEVCGIHAEAMSAAEMLHGPISMASPRLPAIVLAGDRDARPTVEAAVARWRAAGAPVLVLDPDAKAWGAQTEVVALPLAPHSLLQPVAAAQAVYPFVAALARARGRDPDRPRHLQKVTQTL
jgi:glucosamine--fructose-6-phosphate aminotransferase (isomerizing)